jgi:hypothetical protein
MTTTPVGGVEGSGPITIEPFAVVTILLLLVGLLLIKADDKLKAWKKKIS